MAEEFSFDVVSKLDWQEVENAINQANKEIQTRFDFKGSVSRLEADKKELKLTLFSDNDQKLKSVVDVMESKLVRRGISLKALEYKSIEPAERSTVRQLAMLTQGIISEKAKEIARAIKDSKMKVQASIQGDQLRITSKSKDELQSVMAFLRGADFGIALQYVNFR